MLEIQQVKCPSCGSPADADDSNCNYCFAKISRPGASESGGVVAGAMFAIVIGLFVADWYFDVGVRGWLTQTLGTFRSN